MRKKKDISKETLRPITKINSKFDWELQELEVESTKGDTDLGACKLQFSIIIVVSSIFKVS